MLVAYGSINRHRGPFLLRLPLGLNFNVQPHVHARTGICLSASDKQTVCHPCTRSMPCWPALCWASFCSRAGCRSACILALLGQKTLLMKTLGTWRWYWQWNHLLFQWEIPNEPPRGELAAWPFLCSMFFKWKTRGVNWRYWEKAASLKKPTDRFDWFNKKRAFFHPYNWRG